MRTVFEVFIDFVTVLLLLHRFGFFGLEAYEVLAPCPGFKPASPALKGEALTTGLCQGNPFLIFSECAIPTSPCSQNTIKVCSKS